MNIELLSQILLALAPYITPVLVALLTYVVKSAIDRLPANQRSFVSGIVRTAVVAASQMASDTLNGPGKRQIALELIEKELDHFGIKIPSSIINGLIEEAVKGLKMAEGATTTVAVAAVPPVVDVKGN